LRRSYERRQLEGGVLFKVLQEHLDTFLTEANAANCGAGGVPMFVEKELRHGRPVAFYSDKATVFRVNRKDHGGSGITQFGRAMSELNIDVICANTPAAKGRVSVRTPLCKIVWSRNCAWPASRYEDEDGQVTIRFQGRSLKFRAFPKEGPTGVTQGDIVTNKHLAGALTRIHFRPWSAG
jgi:hypothetical protein